MVILQLSRKDMFSARMAASRASKYNGVSGSDEAIESLKKAKMGDGDRHEVLETEVSVDAANTILQSLNRRAIHSKEKGRDPMFKKYWRVYKKVERQMVLCGAPVL